jgi:hypothetical protein
MATADLSCSERIEGFAIDWLADQLNAAADKISTAGESIGRA